MPPQRPERAIARRLDVTAARGLLTSSGVRRAVEHVSGTTTGEAARLRIELAIVEHVAYEVGTSLYSAW